MILSNLYLDMLLLVWLVRLRLFCSVDMVTTVLQMPPVDLLRVILMSVRSVECIALFPVGNSHGDWHCLSLDTFRMLKRSVRPSDIAPMPERVVRLLDAVGSKKNFVMVLLVSPIQLLLMIPV